MEGKPHFHSCLILKECTFASLKVCNLSFVFRGIVLGVSEFRIETPGIYTIDGNSLGFGPTNLVLQMLPVDQGVVGLRL